MEDVMQPGPGLDAKVVRLLGILHGDNGTYCADEGSGLFATCPVCVPRAHSTDIACALEVLEALRKEGWSVGMEGCTITEDDCALDGWAVSLFNIGDEGYAESLSLPHAICLAALRAKGEEGR
jgi:hypothetical protein